jgi:amino-acid N-acetyltransferase
MLHTWKRMLLILKSLNMNIQAISENQYSEIIDLLNRNNLPVSDISAETKLFALIDNNAIIGSIGLEVVNKYALLRSLCVDEKHRNKGAAILLVNFIEDYARELNLKSIYLLTTTAEHFFSNREYKIVERESVPEPISQTSEFKSVCPASATIMKKDLILSEVF